MQDYKFTNAYRASDRVSQYLIRRVIYRDDLSDSANEVFFRIMLFKIFNRIDTWELLEGKVGPICWETYSFKRFNRVLTTAMAKGTRIYSAAYIMPSARSFGHARKHRNHLALIERMLADSLPAQLADAPSMNQAFHQLRCYPTIGDFLAYQYVTDVNYSTITDFSESEFVVPGPGAVDGIRKCFFDTAELSDADVIRFMTDRQEEEFKRLGIEFPYLGDRRLQLIDCQNLFCEVGKYARVMHPEFRGTTGRSRIKQRLKPNPVPIDYWYPPKWNLNALGSKSRSALGTDSTVAANLSSSEGNMDFQTYQVEAAKTDRNPLADDKGIMIPLLWAGRGNRRASFRIQEVPARW